MAPVRWSVLVVDEVVSSHLRRAGYDVHVLTANGEESPAELVARVDAVLRGVLPGAEPDALIEFEAMTIDPAARRVWAHGHEVVLAQREFDLLLFLARHPGQTFTRATLMDRVWRFSFYTDTSTITVHIRRLRAKLEPDPSAPRHIETVWGVGYRFSP